MEIAILYSYADLKYQFDNQDWRQLIDEDPRAYSKWISEIKLILAYLQSSQLLDVNIRILDDDYPDIDCILEVDDVFLEKIQITLAVNQFSHSYKVPRKSRDRHKDYCHILSADIDPLAERKAELQKQLKEEAKSERRREIKVEIDNINNKIFNPPEEMRAMDDIKERQIKYIKKAIMSKMQRSLVNMENTGAVLLIGYYADFTESLYKEFDEFSNEHLRDLRDFCEQRSEKLVEKYSKVIIVDSQSMRYEEGERIKPEIIWVGD